jgi:hypothetical protein
MPRVGFEPTIPVFERAKTDHARDRAATVIGTETNYKHFTIYNTNYNNFKKVGIVQYLKWMVFHIKLLVKYQ